MSNQNSSVIKVFTNDNQFLDMIKHKMMKSFLMLLAAALIGKPVSGQLLEQKIDNYISGYQGALIFSGVVLVSSDDSVLFHKAYGMANYEWNIPNTLKTKFRIASLSKAFTAVLVLQMVEKGRISLDSTISDYLPEYPSPNGDSITIHQLLCHTSGIPHYDAIPAFDPKYTRLPVASGEYINLIASLDLLFHPGSRYHYSSFGYFILGAILERVSGLSFTELLNNNILIPTGMRETTFDDMVTLQSYRASGYNFDQTGIINCNYEDTYKSVGCGGMISTAKDLYLWSQALDSNKLLSEPFRNLIFQRKQGPYGYGWALSEEPGNGVNGKQVLAYHGGSDFGFASYIFKNLSNGKCIIVLSNLESAPVEKIARLIYRIMLGDKIQPPVSKKYVTVSKSIYSKCAGRYQVSKDYWINVFEEKHGLTIQWTGLNTRLLLFPVSGETYFLRENNKDFTFNENVNGVIESLSFNDREGIITAKKIF